MASIFELVQQLQDAMRERFGVEAQVELYVMDTANPVMTKQLAEYVGNEIAAQVDNDDIKELGHGNNGDTHWMACHTHSGFSYTGFYPNKAEED